jgi:hypothetical protein
MWDDLHNVVDVLAHERAAVRVVYPDIIVDGEPEHGQQLWVVGHVQLGERCYALESGKLRLLAILGKND